MAANGGSDVPLSLGDEAAAAATLRLAPAMNLAGVRRPIAVTTASSNVSRKFEDGPTLAKVFNGSITQWNNPRSQALKETAASRCQVDQDSRVPRRESRTTDARGTCRPRQRAWEVGRWKGSSGAAASARARGVTVTQRPRNAGSATWQWSFAQAQHGHGQHVHFGWWGPSGDYYRLGRRSDRQATISGVNATWCSSTRTRSTGRLLSIVLATYEIVCSKYPDSQDWHGTAKAFAEHYRRRSKQPGDGCRAIPIQGGVQIEAVGGRASPDLRLTWSPSRSQTGASGGRHAPARGEGSGCSSGR